MSQSDAEQIEPHEIEAVIRGITQGGPQSEAAEVVRKMGRTLNKAVETMAAAPPSSEPNQAMIDAVIRRARDGHFPAILDGNAYENVRAMLRCALAASPQDEWHRCNELAALSETPPQPASEAVENALDAVQRAFGSDWTPEQGAAMDSLVDVVRAALRATPQPAIEKGTPRTDALSNKFWHELRLAGELTFEQEAKIFARHVREAEKLALELERELVTTRWELNERRGLDKAREEDRLAVRAALLGKTTAEKAAMCDFAKALSPEQPHEAPTPRTDALVRVVLGVEYCNATEMKDNARRLERALAALRADGGTAKNAARYEWLRLHWEAATGLTWRDPPAALDSWIDEEMAAPSPSSQQEKGGGK